MVSNWAKFNLQNFLLYLQFKILTSGKNLEIKNAQYFTCHIIYIYRYCCRHSSFEHRLARVQHVSPNCGRHQGDVYGTSVIAMSYTR